MRIPEGYLGLCINIIKDNEYNTMDNTSINEGFVNYVTSNYYKKSLQIAMLISKELWLCGLVHVQ